MPVARAHPSRSRPRPRWRLLAASPIAVAVLGLAGLAHAQEYRLGDDDQWTQVSEPDPGSPAAQLQRIRARLADGDWDRVEFLATRWIETNPGHPLTPEAYLLRGDALFGRGDQYDALFDYEYLVRAFPGSDAFGRALEREYRIACNFLAGRKRKILGLRIASAVEEAEELLIRVQERLPGSRLAEQAAITLADHYFAQRRMKLAAEMYAIFLRNHPRSVDVPKARKRLIAANLAGFAGPEFDASGLIEARTRIEDLVADDPASVADLDTTAILIRIEESLAEKQLRTARWYARSGDPISAERVLRRLIRDRPRTAAAAEGARFALELMPGLPERVQRQDGPYRELLGLPTTAETDDAR
ncbi:MAG: outer membrane protein assembly factor BamD [Planctomycetota bacterium]